MKCTVACAALLLVAGCSRPDAERAEVRAPEHAAPARNELRLTAEMEKKWGVRTSGVVRLQSATSIALPGSVGFDEQHTARISSLLDGKVVSIKVDLGDLVRRDQVLLVIHSLAFAQAKSAFLQAIAKENLAHKEWERAKALLQQEAIEEKEFLRREAEHENASTEVGVLESNLRSFGLGQAQIDALLERYKRVNTETRLWEMTEPYLEVRSPVEGRVVFRDVIVGEHVPPEKTLFTISDLRTLWANLDAREKDLPYITSGSSVTIRSPLYPDRPFAGRILHVSDVVDEKLRTIKIRVAVVNTGLVLKPNMYIQGVVDTRGGLREVLAVPDEAVQSIEGDSVVFVRQSNGVLAARPVELGEKIGANRAILRGLDGSETVVVAGAFTLKSELMKGTFEGGDH
jgi:cobalt-zinc-cadmium efflux system membrane fusion protein